MEHSRKTSQMGTRTRRENLRHGVLDKYGRIVACAGCLGVGAQTIKSEQIEKDMVDAGEVFIAGEPRESRSVLVKPEHG